jgi:hypothetical protein
MNSLQINIIGLGITLALGSLMGVALPFPYNLFASFCFGIFMGANFERIWKHATTNWTWVDIAMWGWVLAFVGYFTYKLLV